MEIPETDTFPAKTMTVLRGVGPAIHIEIPDVVASGAVDIGGHPCECDDGMSISEYCAEK